MSEYVDKEEILKELKYRIDLSEAKIRIGKGDIITIVFNATLNVARDYISALSPASVSHIVRCKDCKHRNVIKGHTTCGEWGNDILIMHPEEFFCQYGERRNENG